MTRNMNKQQVYGNSNALQLIIPDKSTATSYFIDRRFALRGCVRDFQAGSESGHIFSKFPWNMTVSVKTAFSPELSNIKTDDRKFVNTNKLHLLCSPIHSLLVNPSQFWFKLEQNAIFYANNLFNCSKQSTSLQKYHSHEKFVLIKAW